MSEIPAIPDGHHSITPHIVLRGCAKAIEFYKKAFGAEELGRMMAPGGESIMHAQIRIGNSILMLCDEMPQMRNWVSPQKLSGTTVVLHLWSEHPHELFERAVKAGATSIMPLADMFWGDLYGRLADPFGHEWSIAKHLRDQTPEETDQRAAEFFAKNVPPVHAERPAAKKGRASQKSNGRPAKAPAKVAKAPAAKKSAKPAGRAVAAKSPASKAQAKGSKGKAPSPKREAGFIPDAAQRRAASVAATKQVGRKKAAPPPALPKDKRHKQEVPAKSTKTVPRAKRTETAPRKLI